MKPMKKLFKAIEAANLPEYVIEQLSDNPHLSTSLKRLCKPPHIKEGHNPYDTKTKYGLLYVSFNNMKKKLDLTNYDERYEFIDRWMSDKKFVKLFKTYKSNNFNRAFRPSLLIKNTIAEFPFMDGNVEWITYAENIKSHNMKNAKQVTEMSGETPRKIYDSISQAAEKSGNNLSTVRYHLKQSGHGKFRYTTFAHKKHIEDLKKRIKKDKNKMGVKI